MTDTAGSRWPVKTMPPAVAADVMAARKRPIRFIRLGRFVLCWEAKKSAGIAPYAWAFCRSCGGAGWVGSRIDHRHPGCGHRCTLCYPPPSYDRTYAVRWEPAVPLSERLAWAALLGGLPWLAAIGGLDLLSLIVASLWSALIVAGCAWGIVRDTKDGVKW